MPDPFFLLKNSPFQFSKTNKSEDIPTHLKRLQITTSSFPKKKLFLTKLQLRLTKISLHPIFVLVF